MASPLGYDVVNSATFKGKGNQMERESFDIDHLNAERRKAIQASIKAVDISELKGMAEQIFPYSGHPWEERFTTFLQENAGESFYHALTQDGFHIVYCPGKDKGIWYRQGQALGIVQPKGLRILKEIVSNG